MNATKILTGLLFYLALSAITTVVNGFVLSVLWGWFVVTTFGLPPLSIAAAAGLAMVITFTTFQLSTQKEQEMEIGEVMLKVLLFSLIRAIPTLGVGYVITLFM